VTCSHKPASNRERHSNRDHGWHVAGAAGVADVVGFVPVVVAVADENFGLGLALGLDLALALVEDLDADYWNSKRCRYYERLYSCLQSLQ